VVNLGIGIPEGVANVAAEEYILDYLTLTAEPGAMGGMPTGGLDFGSAVNAQAILDQPSQFDFYDGGRSRRRVPGHRSGGPSGQRQYQPVRAEASGLVRIYQHQPERQAAGVHRDFRRAEPLPGAGWPAGHRRRCRGARVSRRCRAAHLQRRVRGQPMLYVTERCVFRLTPDGLELIEIAPRVDLERTSSPTWGSAVSRS